jgi:hypothetical protein
MIIPSSYNNLTIEQFQKLTVLVTKDQSIERDILILSLLTGKSSFEIEKLTPTVFYQYFAMASFINEPIKSIGLKKSTWLGFKKFKAITEIHDFTTAQHKDFTEIMKANDNNYITCLPNILAICHKELTLKGYVYNSDNHYKNAKIFSQAKIKDVLGAVFFYSKCLKSYSTIIENSLVLHTQMIKEMLEEIEGDKPFQDFLNTGDGNIQ